MLRSNLLAIATFIVLVCATRAAADAALHVCNATGEPASVAIAAVQSGTNGAQGISEGWFQIDAQRCAIVIDTNLDPATPYYLFAKSANIVWAGKRSNARDAQFCIEVAGRFSYVDRTQNLCTGAGQQMLFFINEPVAGPDWTVELDSP